MHVHGNLRQKNMRNYHLIIRHYQEAFNKLKESDAWVDNPQVKAWSTADDTVHPIIAVDTEYIKLVAPPGSKKKTVLHLASVALCDVNGNLILHRYVELPKDKEVYWSWCPISLLVLQPLVPTTASQLSMKESHTRES